jgi:hypothetical protein
VRAGSGLAGSGVHRCRVWLARRSASPAGASLRLRRSCSVVLRCIVPRHVCFHRARSCPMFPCVISRGVVDGFALASRRLGPALDTAHDDAARPRQVRTERASSEQEARVGGLRQRAMAQRAAAWRLPSEGPVSRQQCRSFQLRAEKCRQFPGPQRAGNIQRRESPAAPGVRHPRRVGTALLHIRC